MGRKGKKQVYYEGNFARHSKKSKKEHLPANATSMEMMVLLENENTAYHRRFQKGFGEACTSLN